MKRKPIYCTLRTTFSSLLVLSFLQGCGGGGDTKPPPVTSPPPVVTPPVVTPPVVTPPVVTPPTPEELPAGVDAAIDVNLNMKHVVGEVSTFDRSKFITIHTSLIDREWPDAQTRDAFFKDYDVYMGRNNGGMPWQLSRLQGTAVDGHIDNDQSVTFGTQSKGWHVDTYNQAPEAIKALEDRAKNMMHGGQMIMYPHNEMKLACPANKAPCNNTNEWLADFAAGADFYAAYLSNYFGTGGTTGQPKPLIVEVLNEPIWNASKYRASSASISEFHSSVAKKIKAEHPEVKVGGYTAAWPGIEEDNFGKFDDTWKTFIDIAGDDIDFYSIHLYDSHRDGKVAYRTGANIEAILDTIDQYSILTVGERRPWSISEYGYFAPQEPAELQAVSYSKLRDWFNIRSFSSMMMSAMDRPDQILNSIPFHILKALWSGDNGLDDDDVRYGIRTFIMEKELDGAKGYVDDGNSPYIYSEVVKWYQLWSEVKGTRVDSSSTELDLQVDSYVDGNTVYLILNNLEPTDALTAQLNLAETTGQVIQSITSKHLYYDETENTPVLEELTLANDVETFTVDAESTAIIKVVYASDLEVNQTSAEAKYYSTDYRKAITADTDIEFQINGVDATSAEGEAQLRLSVGRGHTLSKQPSVTINGVELNVPDDVRGYYENAPRDEFFGVIEIPVPYDALNTDNNIVIKFSDTGGTVAAATLRAFNMTAKAERFGQ